MKYELKKNLAGAFTVKFECPKCSVKLSESLNNAGQQDICPECGQSFAIPGAEELKRQREIEAKLAAEKESLKQAEVAEKNRLKKERERQKQEFAANARREREQADLKKQQEAEQHRRSQREQMDQAKQVIKEQAASQIPTILLQISIALLLAAILGVQVVSVFQRRNAWEYMISAPSDSTLQDSLDSYGENGWELVTARRASSSGSNEFSYECIFKRRK